MSSPRLYPLTFTPVLKHYIWGGRNLEKLFGRELPGAPIAESWEIAAHRDGTVLVGNGVFKGWGLDRLHAELGQELVGREAKWAQERGVFPLMVKLLDATRNLSVQVHPDDNYALAHEGNELGKTEMWVVLHAQPTAEVILGVKAGTSRKLFQQALHHGNLEPLLHRIPVKRGDVVCVPAGSVHAILGGSVLAEVQQNSNTTYRVFDWNRLQNGKPRPLHIQQALDVINFEQIEPAIARPQLVSEDGGIRRHVLCRNQYFVTERLEMKTGSIFQGNCHGDTLEIWGAIDGNVMLNELTLEGIAFTLLPASMGSFSVAAKSNSTLLRIYIGGDPQPPNSLGAVG